MKTTIIIFSVFCSCLCFSQAINEPRKHNTIEKPYKFKVNDSVVLKKNSLARKYVNCGGGIIERICTRNYVKINGYFIRAEDIYIIIRHNKLAKKRTIDTLIINN